MIFATQAFCAWLCSLSVVRRTKSTSSPPFASTSLNYVHCSWQSLSHLTIHPGSGPVGTDRTMGGNVPLVLGSGNSDLQRRSVGTLST
ncbi:hypothetical protein EV424DRAFT_449128 [Suillus variegatus]|nr:hypothetical protein EV424DRAFT_449128 [Suillus variegatus]